MLEKVKRIINNNLRKIINRQKRKRLINKNFSLVSSNCNGGVILHDLGLPFNSPFVNLWIRPDEYVKLCENLPYYLGCELKFICEDGIEYPVGILDDVRLYFLHYTSEDEARIKWNIRLSRMDWEHIYILFTDRDGCTTELLKRFDRLPYPKVVFVHKPMPEIKSAVYIRGFEEDDEVGICSEFCNCCGRRYYDDFDYVDWINSKE